MHRLFDPVIERSALLGAGLDWKTSLQELTADREASACPSTWSRTAVLTTRSCSAPWCKVGSRELGAGEGRSKKAAEQLAAEAAYRSITAESAREPVTTPVCASGPAPASADPIPASRRRIAGCTVPNWPAAWATADVIATPQRAIAAQPDRRSLMPELPEVETVRAGPRTPRRRPDGRRRQVLQPARGAPRPRRARRVRRRDGRPHVHCAPNAAASTSGSPSTTTRRCSRTWG